MARWAASHAYGRTVTPPALPLSTSYLEVRRDDLATTRLVDEPVPDIEPGQALLRIERFGLTANNVTYGVAGDTLGYWRFFPAAEGWGRIPAWGFAEVVASEVDGLDVGARVFGYVPMGTHLLVEPTKVRNSGFTDASAHRAELPAPYNAYRRVDADPLYSPDDENLQALLLPLYMTSFVLDDYLDDNAWFGAQQVITSSASAKTAIGTATLSAGRQVRPRIVGLTSTGNVDFVSSLGCYDTVVPYGSLDRLDTTRPAVYVDVAGDTTLRAEIHERFGDALTHSCVVGMSHWDAPHTSPVNGPRPTLFFAPSQIEKRIGEWGGSGYQQRLGDAWSRLVTDAATWLQVNEADGLPGAQQTYARLLAGQTDPRSASVVVLAGSTT